MKSMKRSLLTLTLFAFISSIVFGQHGEDDPLNSTLDVVSPTAASLGEYGNTPVDLSTGKPNISVPLYTVQEGNLAVPISLSYDATGIRVKEQSSWVGLKFALNSGGVITRIVRGLPDEDVNGFLNQKHIPDDSVLDEGEDSDYTFLDEVTKREIDMEPDHFFFNFPGGAGKFVMDNCGTVFTMPYEDFKIEIESISGNRIEQILITDPNGVKYYFGKSKEIREGVEYTPSREITRTNPGALRPLFIYVSAWYLMDVVSADGRDHIEFNYIDHGSSSQQITEKSEYINFLSTDNSIGWAGASYDCSSTYDGISQYTTHTEHIDNQQKLASIKFKNGEVVFASSDSREDIDNDKRLESIFHKQYKWAIN